MNHGDFSDRRPVLVPGKNGQAVPSFVPTSIHFQPGPNYHAVATMIVTPQGPQPVIVGGVDCRTEVAMKCFAGMAMADMPLEMIGERAFLMADAFIAECNRRAAKAQAAAQQQPQQKQNPAE